MWAGDGPQEGDMQRMFMRTLILAAVGAVTVMVVDDAQARHRRRGGCGSSGGSYNGGSYGGGYGGYGGGYGGGGYYANGYGYNGGYSGGYATSRGYGGNYGAYGPGVYSRGYVRGGAAGMTYDANGRLIGPAVDRTARGSAVIDNRARVGGQISPSNNVRAGANVDASGRAIAPRTNAGVRATGDANADVNRNDGTIRSNVEGNVRGAADANVPAPPDSGALPPPVPDAPAVPNP